MCHAFGVMSENSSLSPRSQISSKTFICLHIAFKSMIHLSSGFPGGLVVKNLPANAGDEGSIPESGRSPGEGNSNPLQYSCWEIPRTEEPGGLQSIGSQRSRTRLGN